MINLESESAEEIRKQFSYLTNNLLFMAQQTAEEYRNSKLMEELDLCWIRTLASPDYRTDLRNEAASRVGKQLASVPLVMNRLERPADPKMEDVAQKMAREHRTLQQTFSELVFCHFLTCCSLNESKILTDLLGEDFYRLPLI